ncbi:hypothetical protein CYMTET_4703 [Cymbomonas tetramitiformis]|uniref:Succinate dehydrogenase assembly factor 2, mitochondrial n=1 Tax=Cymbomonas tetramitiformis TaxID=36881 RepID=A0AAE0LJT4_9CHLO|nr:hypothetical protein CYMTET_4703 [Cymbomonas tetramitiformis]
MTCYVRNRGFAIARTLVHRINVNAEYQSSHATGALLRSCAVGQLMNSGSPLQALRISRTYADEKVTTLAKDGLKGQFEYGTKTLDREAAVKRLLYRSKQRGFLEMDLIIGQWAEANLKNLSDEQLNCFALVLDEENPDLFRYLTGQEDAPEHLVNNSVYNELKQSMEGYLKVGANARAKKGVPWVRGWEDSGKGMKGNQ